MDFVVHGVDKILLPEIGRLTVFFVFCSGLSGQILSGRYFV